MQEGGFYRNLLAERYQVNAIVPDESGRARVDDIIYRELCLGAVRPQSKIDCMQIIEGLRKDGADRVILGCTGSSCSSDKLVWISRCSTPRRSMPSPE